MADTKITALTAITTVDPAVDVLPIVDVSDTSMAASGTTKKITSNQILGAGGTATLASATITGDLTVDTSTLKVDSANNRVGIGTASPTYLFDVLATGAITATSSFAMARITGASAVANDLTLVGPNTSQVRINFGDTDLASVGEVGYDHSTNRMRFVTNNQQQYTIDPNGVFTWYDGAGGTRMTLNSTGLAIGTSALGRLAVAGSAVGSGIFSVDSDATRVDIQSYNKPLALNRGGNNITMCEGGGNVGIGVTPSASWFTGAKVLQFGATGAIVNNGLNNSIFSNNAVIGNSGSTYIASSAASYYAQTTGAHIFYTAPSGTAGNPISGANAFVQAMTLDASGNLLVGKSVSLFSTVGVEASGTGFISATNSASTNATTNLSVYSTGAAAFRFYVGLGGTVYATNTTISAISDARLKENVQDIDVGLGAILALKPRKFDWKAGKGKDIKGDRGFIAQEFEQVFPQLVDEWKDEAPEGESPYKSVRQDLIPVLVKAIQELAAEVNALKNA